MLQDTSFSFSQPASQSKSGSQEYAMYEHAAQDYALQEYAALPPPVVAKVATINAVSVRACVYSRRRARKRNRFN
jgi:hypothetical protein